MKSSNVKSISLKIKRFGNCLEVSYFCSLLNSSTCCLTKTEKKLNEKRKKRNKMKKKVICSMMLALGFAFAANAQTPPAPGESATANANQRIKEYSVKGQGPLAPATLLLLGLAGGFAGVKVYRNNKKREE